MKHLDQLDDAGLEQAIKDAQETIRRVQQLQGQRKKTKQSDAIQAAREKLAEAGLTFRDVAEIANKDRKRSRSAPAGGSITAG